MFNTRKELPAGTKGPGLLGGGAPKQHLTALLDVGTTFEGRLTFSGTIHINGRFTGEISGNDHLVVLENGSVSGEIEVGSIEIAGEVTGQIRAREKVILKPSGRFRGELEAPVGGLEIQPGANFDGTCRMGAGAQPAARLSLATAEATRAK